MSDKNCRYIQILTPKNYILDGLLFGSDKAKKGIIFVHGLGATVFSGHKLLTPLAGKDTAVMFFNNRGYGDINGIKKIDRKSEKGYTRVKGGEAYEVFTECADDIQGAVNYFLKNKVKEIYLVGHSTGCQKIVYYLSQKNNQKKIKGAILLCPISDYAGIKKNTDPKKLKRAQDFSRKLVRQHKPHQLLPEEIWPDLLDAQRFLSLYTPDSKEEIFCYVEPNKIPRTLQKVKIPLLSVFAGNDEYRDRDIEEIKKWFEKNIKSKQSIISVIPNSLHSFNGKENQAAKMVGNWVKAKK